MWHRTGTISVTAGDTTVTGVGTGFVSGVRTGDGLQAPDGRFYEIVNVASDTALSIAPAYMGPTEEGKDYWIVPVPGYTKGLADQVAQLLRQIGLLPGDVDANTQDIARLLQSMTENTQAIVSNEGRIANAEQAMLTKNGNLLGLENLKQSQLNLGVIESLVGTIFNTDNCKFFENQHGIAFRFLDQFRLQVCISMIENTGMSINKSIGGGFRSDGKVFNFPVPFISAPAVSASAIYKGGSFGVSVECVSPINALTYTSLAFNSLVSIPDSSVPGIRLLAVGVY